ncbi:hypothetical protein C6497_05015 [Candidatus Poribacteria bacterium]|nr:MAG: hypothetical protein C6497_05015 [Candidatus Poribacteria bacterium]
MTKNSSPTEKTLSKDNIQILEDILDCKIDELISGSVFDTSIIETILNNLPTDSLTQYLSPQWVILAAGKGTRIDPTGKMSKTLDIMLGEHNILQRSRQYLPGNLQNIVIINKQMAARITKHNSQEKLLGTDVIPCVQEEMNGTGGALQAAISEIRKSNAEWIGVAFGDEPFLDKKIFAGTLLSHLLSNADITLCGKIPETVEDKGGLFFDNKGELMCTKEWYDMTEEEQNEMWHRLDNGNAYTNTGITIIRKSALLKYIDKLKPHANRNNELHHVDLIRHFYDDGLKTNAFIYKGEVLSGVNRWSNMLVGEETLYAQTRKLLATKGVRVDPSAQITLADEDMSIGIGCYLIGKIHIGKQVKIGDYCRLENLILQGNTSVGDSVGLQNVDATDTSFANNTLSSTISKQVHGLNTISNIYNSKFNQVSVGNNVQLSRINAHITVIPSNIRLDNQNLGVPYAQTPYNVPNQIFKQIVPLDYRPGVYTFGEKKDLPDWDNLRNHIDSHSKSELIPRSTKNQQIQETIHKAVLTLLDMRRENNDYVIESLTAEEVWGTIFEMVKIHTGNLNPYHRDKIKARQTAVELLPKFWNDDWLTRLKLVVAGNVIDYSSSRVVERVNSNPQYFTEALTAAVETPFAIDCYEQFNEKVIHSSQQQILWLVDNDGEIIFDLAFIQDLLICGHQICIVGKVENASNDVTLEDLHDLSNYPEFEELKSAIQNGDVTLISSGSKTIGTNLYRSSPEFMNALLESDIVISKGQGNFFTTPGWMMDTFYLLMSKGVTAERTTGVVANKDLPVDGLILAYLEAGTERDKTLMELCDF